MLQLLHSRTSAAVHDILSVYALAFCSMNTADVVLGDTSNISPAVFSAVALAVEIIFLLVITLLCSRTALAAWNCYCCS